MMNPYVIFLTFIGLAIGLTIFRDRDGLFGRVDHYLAQALVALLCWNWAVWLAKQGAFGPLPEWLGLAVGAAK